MDKQLAGVAGRQHGLIARRQLIDAGVRPRAIKHLQRTGRLEEARPGVYRVWGAPTSWEHGLWAIQLSVGGAVASHATGTRCYGVKSTIGDYEISTPRARQVRLPGVTAHRSVLWLPEDSRLRNGLLVSAPARIVVDLSGRLDATALGDLVDEMLRRRLLRLDDLARTRGRFGAARGRRPAAIDELLRARLTGYEPGDSNLEARIIRALAAARLPMPTAQHRVRVDGRRMRVDLCYPRLMLAIEIDSWAYHQWRSTFDRDRARRNDLTLAGFTVLQVTDGMSDIDIVALVGRAIATLGRSGIAQRPGPTQRSA